MKVLLAVDGSEKSADAVDHCLSTAWTADTEIKVFSVIDPGTQIYGPSVAEMMCQRAEALVHEYCLRLKERLPELQISTGIGLGYESETIVEECNKWKADLVVLGSHGEGGGRLWLGSVSKSVLNHAHCP
ncbi:MAG: universal stress protein, partial [Cyanobacteria bacterium]|nr:universal stress protein [Cyanobacteriota bacterium]